MLCLAADRTVSVEVRAGLLFHSSQNWVSGGQRGCTVSQLVERSQWRSERVYCFTASSQNWVSGGQRGYTVSQLMEWGQWRSERVYCFTDHKTWSVETRQYSVSRELINRGRGGQRLIHVLHNWASGGHSRHSASQLTVVGHRSARVHILS